MPGGRFPRELRPKERDLLESVLPPDRAGYRTSREFVGTAQVLAQGRRGAGNLVLGSASVSPDLAAPLPPVFAYGMVETTRDTFSITVREPQGDQVEVEIVSSHEEEIPDHFEEKRRWTYSDWSPGQPSPANGAPLREVPVGADHVLVIAPEEKRLWIHERSSGLNLLIPATAFYHDVMAVRRIRDPRVALHPNLLFEGGMEIPDTDLRAAFLAYNVQRRRVVIRDADAGTERRGLMDRVMNVIRQYFTRQP